MEKNDSGIYYGLNAKDSNITLSGFKKRNDSPLKNEVVIGRSGVGMSCSTKFVKRNNSLLRSLMDDIANASSDPLKPRIDCFREEYFFLSNFYDAPITYNGLTYRNNEAAFQAQKCLDEDVRKRFIHLNASGAKKMGRSVQLREDWEDVKLQIMFQICMAKFLQNEELRKQLLATEDFILEEDNTWGDKFWGTVNGAGENNLGKTLMIVRNLLG